MKKISLLFIAFLLLQFTTLAQSGWVQQTSGTQANLSSVFFVNNDVGWVVCDEGTILKTTDGGSNWFDQISGTSGLLEAVHFANSNIGWIAGSMNKGIILKTTDGGTNWESQLNTISPWLHSITILNENTGWAVGDGGTILKTTNGGVTFIENEDNNIVQPKDYLLEQNYPNPFNPLTKIKFTIPSVIASGAKQSQMITLRVYDILGNEIAVLINEDKQPGNYEVEFDALNLTSGVYFYQLKASSFVETKKMILLK